MAVASFGDLWRELRLYSTSVPVPLAKNFVRDAYRKVLDITLWGATVSENQFLIPAAYTTGTVTVTNNSTSVTGAGTAFTSAMIGRQFYTGGNAPFYTISAVPDATTLTLERAFGGTTAAGITYSITLIYQTAPSDLIGLLSVRDPVNNWRLRLHVPQETLDRIDTQRSASGTPWCLSDYRFSSSGVPRYELYPKQTSQAVYPFLYWRRPSDLSADTDTPIYPIRDDVIKYAALANLALWPGTAENPNPMFDIRTHGVWDSKFREEITRLVRQDQEIYPSDLRDLIDSQASLPWAPIDAKFMQSHEFAL